MTNRALLEPTAGRQGHRAAVAPRPDMAHVYAVVLAGGFASRFWPENKLFARLTGSARSMIQETVARGTQRLEEGGPFQQFIHADQFYVATGPDFAEQMRAELPEIPAAHIFTEPARRNTWPAILWAMLRILDTRPEAADEPASVLLLLTGDHVIGDWPLFRWQVAQALEAAQNLGAIVTIGIQPSDDPERWTGFGAIRASHPVEPGVCRVEVFREKPSLDRARQMHAEGGWYWNSGMYALPLRNTLRALAHFQPEISVIVDQIREALARQDEKSAQRLFLSLPTKVPHPEDSSQVVILADRSEVPSGVARALEAGDLAEVSPDGLATLPMEDVAALPSDALIQRLGELFVSQAGVTAARQNLESLVAFRRTRERLLNELRRAKAARTQGTGQEVTYLSVKLADNSIDYALSVPMTQQPLEAVPLLVVPGTFPSTDIGAWDALWEVRPTDADANVILGEVTHRNVRNSALYAAPGRRVVVNAPPGQPLDHLIVVHAANGSVLVTRRSRAQDVRKLFAAASADPTRSTLSIDCTNCCLQPDAAAGGRIGALALRDIDIIQSGDTVTVTRHVGGRDLARAIS